jgi:hypothetical protein
MYKRTRFNQSSKEAQVFYNLDPCSCCDQFQGYYAKLWREIRFFAHSCCVLGARIHPELPYKSSENTDDMHFEPVSARYAAILPSATVRKADANPMP